MSSLALMRWLEGAPGRYDAGMRFITFGGVTKLHRAVVAAAVAKPGDRVLEIGCGTGSVTRLLLDRGAVVTAIDQSPEMLEQARERIGDEPRGAIRFIEQTASEIDALPEASFDSVVLSLCLSDMSASERKDREEFVVEACHLMRDRLVGEEIAEALGLDPKEVKGIILGSPVMKMFRQALFARVVPNIKKLGLLTPRVRAGFEELGIIQFEDVDPEDQDRALGLT